MYIGHLMHNNASPGTCPSPPQFFGKFTCRCSEVNSGFGVAFAHFLVFEMGVNIGFVLCARVIKTFFAMCS